MNTGNANFVLHSRIEDPYKDNYFTAELTCVETIDFDSDGYLDLYLGYSMMPNVILRNQGPGTSFIRHYDAGSLTADVEFTYATRVLDLNNDGKMDLLGLNRGQANSLHLNDGKGRFHRVTGGPLTAKGCSGSTIVFVDLNGDALSDIFIGDSDGVCAPELYINSPINSFFQPVNAPESQSSTQISLAFDVDGDGIIDIVDFNGENTPNALFKGNGDAQFTSIDGGSLTNGDVTTNIKLDDSNAVAFDCDQDGDNDVFVSSKLVYHDSIPSSELPIHRHHSLQLHVNDGTGNFTWRTMEDFLIGYDTASESWLQVDNDDFAHKIVHLLALDANNDGNTDLFIVRRYFRNSLLINRGNCTFTEHYVDGTENSPEHAYAVALDIENDGDDDLFVVGFGLNNMYVNDGMGNFTRRECGEERGHPEQFHKNVVAFDVDNDGDVDLVVGPDDVLELLESNERETSTEYRRTSTLYINDGRGRFQPSDGGDLSTMQGQISRFVPFDMDNDGDIDLFCLVFNWYSFALLNDGHGKFSHAHLPSELRFVKSALILDADDDGDYELYVAGYGQNSLYTNCGKGFTGTGGVCMLSSTPSVDVVMPARAETVGGTNLIVRGEFLVDNADPTLFVGGNPCISTRYISDDTWLCVLPPGRPGAANVTAESINRLSRETVGLFHYDTPEIRAVHPEFVYRNSSSLTFTIGGANFGVEEAYRSVHIGGHECMNVASIEEHYSLTCVLSAEAFFSDFDRHDVTVTVNNHTTRMAGAVCHKLQGADPSARCLCGVGRAQIDGVCTVCPNGEFNLNPLSERCLACPAQATCKDGTSISSPKGSHSMHLAWRTSPGYWVSASVWNFCGVDDPACFMNRVEKCKADNARSACPGGAPGVCGKGYDATTSLCGRCLAGYSRDEITSECTKCEGRESAWLQMAGLVSGFLLLLYLIYFILKRAGVNSGFAIVEIIESGLDHPVMGIVDEGECSALSGLVNIITGYVQVIGQSLQIFSVDFPSYFAGILDVLRWFTLPLFSFMGAQCFSFFAMGFAYDPFVLGFSFQATLPWFIVGFYTGLFCIVRFFNKSTKKDIFVKIICFILTYVHPSVSATMFRLYNCKSIYASREKKQEFLDADPGVECFTSTQWQAMAGVSIFMLVAFIFGWPIFVYFLLRRLHRTPMKDDRGRVIMKRVRTDRAWMIDLDNKPIISEVEVPSCMLDDPTICSLYGTLFSDFKPQFYWYVNTHMCGCLLP